LIVHISRDGVNSLQNLVFANSLSGSDTLTSQWQQAIDSYDCTEAGSYVLTFQAINFDDGPVKFFFDDIKLLEPV